ncbi:hypothetical protein [Bacillus cereus group sp. RP43]|uniref:hypothetical protein n=1 Tax=Bacillus cereus group sp. RP43 TaxID=3040260 RepID=UPI0033980599
MKQLRRLFDGVLIVYYKEEKWIIIFSFLDEINDYFANRFYETIIKYMSIPIIDSYI